MFCVDGLTEFRGAINALFPHSQIQHCIIHQIRSLTKYVSYIDIKAVMADLKKVYQAVSEDEALNALMLFTENWNILSTFYAYPAEIRKIYSPLLQSWQKIRAEKFDLCVEILLSLQ